MNTINWIEEWYQSNCDTDWEHVYGVKINTLDNPGWMVTIDLADTSSMNKAFKNINIDNACNDWMTCRVVNNVFEGFGDPLKLEKILKVFKDWITGNTLTLE